MPSAFQFIPYVGGGTLGLVLSGAVFFPINQKLGFALVLLGGAYFFGGAIGFLIWDAFTFA